MEVIIGITVICFFGMLLALIHNHELRETIINKNDTIALLRNEITIHEKYRKEYIAMKEREGSQCKQLTKD